MSTYTTVRGFLEYDEKTLQDTIDETFVTPLSDKSVAELKENGSQIKVTFANRNEYVNRVFNARLHEHDIQIESIRRGIGKVVPIQLLQLLSWQELELLICGVKYVDIDMLRRYTTYASGVDAIVIM
eukprot:TRINITY_DN13128_c0_g1_i1.p1 TRINITY_DN13128_c0_g1~~TRINITY_DN13128_c0_g1_i1.p1  ORF type:complete len:127 (+),score=23.01 TRINITY_DN13128_c0_g1_i1:423-803(+)